VPEGDTIHKTAATLHRALAGRPLTALRISAGTRRRPADGTLVSSVEARGKHVLMRFADGTVLHTHLGMHGSWHVYRPAERWLRGSARVRAVVEVLTERELERHHSVAGLGPDLTSDPVDVGEAVRRARRVPASIPVASLLLDQRVAAGIGNVYKSEVLFACRVDPFANVGSLDDATIRELFVRASAMLHGNAERRGPRTTSRGGLAVYGRTGRPCRRCGTAVRSIVQGEERRRTYWCPRCQAAAPVPAAS
jgi:endonuclease-8